MKRLLPAAAIAAAIAISASPASAFCGFYVAKADAKLFNKASKVVVARKDNRTVVTMASDYEGDPKEFALVIPVPTVVKKEQIHITENGIVDHLDAYSAPRLVEYHDPDPCAARMALDKVVMAPAATRFQMAGSARTREDALGVKIEAQYTVGEYDILILSAKQSDGLATWLGENGYQLPPKAAPVLASYIKQDMKFFVAKVNLKEKAKLGGGGYLRPIQVAYETNKFMLPIRLGTVNAQGPQDMIALMLTEKGRVETTNYRTLKLPTGMDVPIFAKAEFGDFYRAMFDHEVKKDGMRAVYLEYAWNMGWCDPCAADPIPTDKLVELGAFWLAAQGAPKKSEGPVMNRRGMPFAGPQNAFITRLHVRYDAEHFPEDLMFQETGDAQNFQGRYVLRHPYTGEPACEAANDYRKTLPDRFKKEAETLASLTGWDMATIRAKMARTGQSLDGVPASVPANDRPWYERMWKK